MTWTSLSPGYNTTWVCIVHIVQIDIHGLFLSLCHIFVAPTRPRFGALRAHSRRLLVAAKDKLETSGARAHEVLYDLPDLTQRIHLFFGLASSIPLGGARAFVPFTLLRPKRGRVGPRCDRENVQSTVEQIKRRRKREQPQIAFEP